MPFKLSALASSIALMLAATPSSSVAGTTHCATPVANLKVCAAPSSGNSVTVAASGAWVDANPNSVPTGSVDMGGAHIVLAFTRNVGSSPASWSATAKLSGPGGHLWYVTVKFGKSMRPKAYVMFVNVA